MRARAISYLIVIFYIADFLLIFSVKCRETKKKTYCVRESVRFLNRTGAHTHSHREAQVGCGRISPCFCIH